jgi:hypothetical protein
VTLNTLFCVVTYELVEFEKKPIKVQDFRKITNNFRGIYKIYNPLGGGGIGEIVENHM